MNSPRIAPLRRTLTAALSIAALSLAKAAPVPEEAVSPHYEAVAKHLDLGGVMFAYVDIENDLNSLASLVGDLLRSQGAPPELAKIDLTEVFRTLGISQASALGISSYRRGDRFHNKAFLHFPGPREGFFKVFGGNPGSFLSAKIAPGDSDLIIEQDLDIKAIAETLRKLAPLVGAPEFVEEMEAAMESPVIGSVTAGELMGRGPTKVTIIGRINREQRIRLPEGPDVAEFDLVIAFDGMKWLFPKLKSLVPPDALPQLLVEGDGYEALMTPEAAPPPFAAYRPLLYAPEGENRLYLATRKSYLDACLTADGAMSENEDFKFATAGLPKEGNGLSYISPDIPAEILHLIESSGQSIGAAEMALLQSFGGELTADLKKGIAHVSANLPDGILWVSHSVSSHKANVAMLPLAPVAMAASAVVPVFTKVSGKAQEAKNMNSAKQILLGCLIYASDNEGAFPGSLDELSPDYIPADANVDWVNPEDQRSEPWVYFGKGLSNSSRSSLMMLASPKAVGGSRAVGFVDGSVQTVPEERFIELKAAQE